MAQGQSRRFDGSRSPSCDVGRIGGVTAVVPAFASSRTLARTLDSLLVDNHETIEHVVVVCSPADDAAQLRIAHRYPKLTTITPQRRVSAGAARNLGVRYGLQSEYVLFVDSDCAVPRGGVARLLARARETGAGCVGASILPSRRDSISQARHLLEFKDSEPGVRSVPEWMVPSATLLCSRRAFDVVGGFPDMWPGEDLVFCRLLVAHGLVTDRSHDVVVLHDHPPGFGALLRHQLRLGRTSAMARRLAPMPGGVFIRSPWLAPMLFFGRLARSARWLARYRPRSIPILILLSPLYLGGLAAWTIGFASQAWQKQTSAESETRRQRASGSRSVMRDPARAERPAA